MSTWIQETVGLLALPGPLAAELEVCANEAVTNIINHAYDDAAVHRIHLRLAQASDGVDFVVEDDGRPFNPLDFAPPPATSLQQAPLGGRGILLIRGLTSECAYRRQDGKNILSMLLQPHRANDHSRRSAEFRSTER